MASGRAGRGDLFLGLLPPLRGDFGADALEGANAACWPIWARCRRSWHRSHGPGVILLMDAWNPHLPPVEREAVTRLVEGIGDFNAQVAQ